MATVKEESIHEISTQLIREYLHAIEAVKGDNKLTSKEKLKKLLPPLIKLSKITSPPRLKDHHEFITEDIDLKNELNTEKIINNSEKYSIVGDTTVIEKLGILRVKRSNIKLSYQYYAYLLYCKQVEPISEEEFNEKYPNLNTETENVHNWEDEYMENQKGNPIWEYSGHWIKSKRKHTEQSVQKLIDGLKKSSNLDFGRISVSRIYENWLLTLTQEKFKSKDLLDRILITYTIKRALNGDEKAVDKLCSLFEATAKTIAIDLTVKRGLKRYLPEIEQEAKIILRHLISGFSYKEILKGLLQDDDMGFLNIPKNVVNFYEHWLLKEVPERIGKIITSANIDLLEVDVLLNPYCPIGSETRWKLTPKAIRKFNSVSFRPNKKTNLYTWLFGINKRPEKGVTSGFMQGRFCQYINERLKRYDKTRKNDVLELQDNKIEDKSAFKPSIGDTSEDIIEYTRYHLAKRGFSKRNIEIVIQKLKGFSNAEIAKTHNLSTRQIMYICKKSKSPETTD